MPVDGGPIHLAEMTHERDGSSIQMQAARLFADREDTRKAQLWTKTLWCPKTIGSGPGSRFRLGKTSSRYCAGGIG